MKTLVFSHILKAHPFKLNFVITKECHSKCKNCSIWKETSYSDLSLEEIRSFFKTNSFFRWIDLTGGEPTDHPNFIEIIKIICEESPKIYYIHFPTNGINTKRIVSKTKEIINLNLPIKLIITLSIDGPEVINDDLRGIKGDYLQSIETFNELKKIKGVDCFVGMTLFNENRSEINSTLKSLEQDINSFNINDFHINLGHISTHYYNNGDIEKTDLDWQSIDDLIHKKKRYFSPFSLIEIIFLRYLKKYIVNGQTPLPCTAMKNSIYLSEKGELFPCSIWNKPLGNIKSSNDLKSLINSHQNKETLELIRQKKCPNCWTPCEAFPSMASRLIPDMISEVIRGRV